MKISELTTEFTIYTTNEENELLPKLKTPRKLSSLCERDQVIANNLIRKNLLKKIGFMDPLVVINEA